MSNSSSQSPTLLLVDDEPYVLDSLRRLLESEGFECLTAPSAEKGLEVLRSREVHAVVTDLSLPGEDGIALVRQAREIYPELPVLVLTGAATVQSAVAAMKQGAIDFLTKPVEPDALVAMLRRAIAHGELVDEVRVLRATVREVAEGFDIIGKSSAMDEVLRKVKAAAPTDARVLILGESGTGKELVAHAIHFQSRRSRKPFVRVNCAAIPDTLFESEFFGHRRGAFTGALADREGRFAEAHGGTLALDEVGTLRSEAQAKLLRAIETGEYQPVGDSRTRRADVRVIAISNEDIEGRVRQGTFREDLYYRLAVFPIVVPPLRARLEDIVILTDHFLDKLAVRDGSVRRSLGPGAAEVLARYDWPGNVRELRNAIERATLLAPGDEIGADALAGILEGGMFVSTMSRMIDTTALDARSDLRLRERTTALEKQLIQEALKRSGGKKRDAAVLLGIDPSNFSYYAKKHQLAEGA